MVTLLRKNIVYVECTITERVCFVRSPKRNCGSTLFIRLACLEIGLEYRFEHNMLYTHQMLVKKRVFVVSSEIRQESNIIVFIL